MASSDQTSIRRHGIAAIVAGIMMALALPSWGPAWGQETGDGGEASGASPAEMMAPAGMMQMMMGASSDDSDAAPLTGHGFVMDGDVFTTIDHPRAVGETEHGFLLDAGVFTTIVHPNAGSLPGTGTAVTAIDDCGRIVGFYFDATPMPHGFVRDNGRGARRDGSDFIPIDHPDAGAQTRHRNPGRRTQ